MFADSASVIGGQLQDMRRFAWAFTGTRDAGDDYVAATLEAIVAGQQTLDRALPLEVALFQAMHIRAPQTAGPLTTQHRSALLHHVILERSVTDIATIMQVPPAQVAPLIHDARQMLAREMSGRIFIMTGDAKSEQTLTAIITAQGHCHAPDAGQADVILADDGAGLERIQNLARQHSKTPLALITDAPVNSPQLGAADLITRDDMADQISTIILRILLTRTLTL